MMKIVLIIVLSLVLNSCSLEKRVVVTHGVMSNIVSLE